MASQLEAIPVQHVDPDMEEIYLLREVLASNPFEDAARWHSAAGHLSCGFGRTLTASEVKDRCDLLMGIFERENLTLLHKQRWCMKEEYDEKEHLLDEISELAQEFGYKVKPLPGKQPAPPPPIQQHAQHRGGVPS